MKNLNGFTRKDLKDLHLPIHISQNFVDRIHENIQKVIKLVQTNEFITHFELLEAINPSLALHYTELHKIIGLNEKDDKIFTSESLKKDIRLSSQQSYVKKKDMVQSYTNYTSKQIPTLLSISNVKMVHAYNYSADEEGKIFHWNPSSVERSSTTRDSSARFSRRFSRESTGPIQSYKGHNLLPVKDILYNFIANIDFKTISNTKDVKADCFMNQIGKFCSCLEEIRFYDIGEQQLEQIFAPWVKIDKSKLNPLLVSSILLVVPLNNVDVNTFLEQKETEFLKPYEMQIRKYYYRPIVKILQKKLKIKVTITVEAPLCV
jgi:hypothetical protein